MTEPVCLEIARKMIERPALPKSLEAILRRANDRVAASGGDGRVYGKELRSTQVIASIIASWEESGKARSRR